MSRAADRLSRPPSIRLDLADAGLHASHDLADYFTSLRDHDPVSWHDYAPGHGYWAVTRYADVVSVCRDSELFVSAGGNVLETLMNGGDSGAGRMLAVTDGRRHASLRKVLRPSFTPDALSLLNIKIENATKTLVREAVHRGECDFARDIAAQIPLVAICDLLGVPAADRQFILQRTSAALSSDEANASRTGTRLAKAELLMYFARLADARRAEPRRDLVTLLGMCSIDGHELTGDEVTLNCYSLILGGDETTRLAMIGAVHALARHHEQWLALKAGGVDLAAATEEVLRWTTPALHVGRTATMDTRLANVTIRKGDAVVGWISSANFDEAEFADPHCFDLARSPNRHLSLAYGPHFCLGAHLARIEIRALLTALRELVSSVEICGPTPRVHSSFLSGLSSLPVRLRG